MVRQELADFLRDRRARLRPDDVGLPPGRRRRTPGLRREEVAGLAHMSVEYYARLEQARGPHPSPRVLASLTGALRLSAAERAHLFRLAGAALSPPAGPVRTVPAHVRHLLGHIPDTAAIVTDAGYDVIGYSPLADRLFGGLDKTPNLARQRFLGGPPVADEFKHIAVARLRASAARYPDDQRLTDLLAELRDAPDFTAIWDEVPVHAPGHRVKTMTHPSVGSIKVNCDVLTLTEEDQQVVFITADPGTSADRALRKLAGTR